MLCALHMIYNTDTLHLTNNPDTYFHSPYAWYITHDIQHTYITHDKITHIHRCPPPYDLYIRHAI